MDVNLKDFYVFFAKLKTIVSYASLLVMEPECVNTSVCFAVKMTREASMDSAIVAQISHMGMKQAQALHTDFVTFESSEFAQRLVSNFIGLFQNDSKEFYKAERFF